MVTCKFFCKSKREFRGYPNNVVLFDYEFTPVIATDKDPQNENYKFWKYTPTGQLNVSTVTDGQFEVGREYYLNLTLAAAEGI